MGLGHFLYSHMLQQTEHWNFSPLIRKLDSYSPLVVSLNKTQTIVLAYFLTISDPLCEYLGGKGESLADNVEARHRRYTATMLLSHAATGCHCRLC